MLWLAGMRITDARMNRSQPQPYFAEATGPLSATTVYTLIPGCTISATARAAGAIWSAVGVFDCSVTTIHAVNLMVGRLTVDGSSQSGLSIHAMDTLDRDTVAMAWSGVLGAGSHTFNMEGVINGSGGAGTFQSYSRLAVTITETA